MLKTINQIALERAVKNYNDQVAYIRRWENVDPFHTYDAEEVMKTTSAWQFERFGMELNKLQSRATKISKILRRVSDARWIMHLRQITDINDLTQARLNGKIDAKQFSLIMPELLKKGGA